MAARIKAIQNPCQDRCLTAFCFNKLFFFLCAASGDINVRHWLRTHKFCKQEHCDLNPFWHYKTNLSGNWPAVTFCTYMYCMHLLILPWENATLSSTMKTTPKYIVHILLSLVIPNISETLVWPWVYIELQDVALVIQRESVSYSAWALSPLPEVGSHLKYTRCSLREVLTERCWCLTKSILIVMCI